MSQNQDNSEVRITSKSGGSKGQKDARFDLIPSPFLWGLSRVCGFGARKYDDDNWRRGYSWRLSYGALNRHLHAFWCGDEDYDKESGLHHLLHAAWHCFVLFTFSTNSRYKEYDDRPDKPADESFWSGPPANAYCEDVKEAAMEDARRALRDADHGDLVPVPTPISDYRYHQFSLHNLTTALKEAREGKFIELDAPKSHPLPILGSPKIYVLPDGEYWDLPEDVKEEDVFLFNGHLIAFCTDCDGEGYIDGKKYEEDDFNSRVVKHLRCHRRT